MTLYAVDNIDDAIDATRAFLTPVDRSQWLKLAVVMLFIGLPGANANSVQYSFGGNGAVSSVDMPSIVLSPTVWAAIFAVVAVGILLALVFGLVGSVMEFVFIESLRRETVSLREYWGHHWRRGLRLFGFRLGLFVFVAGTVLLVSLPVLLFVIGPGQIGTWEILGVVVGLLPLLILLAITVFLVHGFTTVFVVPIMMLEDVGVLAGWRRLWPSIRAAWKQYLAYAVASVLLSFVGGILFAVVTGIAAFVLALPFLVLAGVGALLLVVWAPAGWAVIAFVALLFVLTVIVLAAVVQVPIQVYLRYYALLVLGDIEEDFDIITDQRDRIRDTGTTA